MKPEVRQLFRRENASVAKVFLKFLFICLVLKLYPKKLEEFLDNKS